MGRPKENRLHDKAVKPLTRWVEEEAITVNKVLRQTAGHHASLKRGAAGEVVDLGVDLRLLHGFGTQFNAVNGPAFRRKRKGVGADAAIGIH